MNNKNLFITGSCGLEGYEIKEYKGIILNISKYSKNSENIEKFYQNAIGGLIEKAKQLKADAIINFKFENSNDGQILAYGDAVVIRPVKNYMPQTKSPFGKIIHENNKAYISCPNCNARHYLTINENGKITIIGFEDVDEKEPGCQIFCLSCGQKLTIPYT